MITILLLFYFASIYGAYKFFQIVYSQDGKWLNSKPSGEDLITTFMPFLNSAFAILYLTGACYKNNNCLNKFYKLK